MTVGIPRTIAPQGFPPRKRAEKSVFTLRLIFSTQFGAGNVRILYAFENREEASNLPAEVVLGPWQNRDRTLDIEGAGESFERKADSPSC
jgi:hypothetical protein